ncbi:ABC transporter ATP-binding protein [uncultured Dubosiella sp.]|uniref:ABC transporter transmembrane domain-containing protein n=1 Tax=uncultured Dubosiella sp. TaxID=1937011 RepID=UPI0025B40345|nr:ABC transporter ATP-binding protein [uncultured Dubosiella sp.]
MKISDLLRQSMKENRMRLALSLVLVVLLSLLDLYFSILLKDAIDAIVNTDPNRLTLCAIKSGILAAGYGIVYTLYCRARNAFLFHTMNAYRTKTFETVMRQSGSTFCLHSNQDHVAMLTTNMDNVREEGLDPIGKEVSLLATGIGALVLMVSYNSLLTGLALGVSLLPLVLSFQAGKPLAQMNEQVAAKQAGLITGAQNLLDNHKDLFVGRKFGFANALYEKKTIPYEQALLDKRVCMQRMSRIGALNALVSQLGLCCAGGFVAIRTNTLTPGEVVVFVQLLNYVIEPVTNLPTLWSRQTGAFRLARCMEASLSPFDDPQPLSPLESIRFEHVDFGWGDKRCLRDFSYTFLSGRSYLIQAPSGFGKTTLLRLMLGILRPDSGTVLYNGKSGVGMDTLLETIAWMPQFQPLLEGTVLENIAFVLNDSDTDVANLSGGQARRVALERILAQNKAWLLLDEPTTGLDPALQLDTLRDLVKSGKTCVVVMHTNDENVLSLFDEVVSLQ